MTSKRSRKPTPSMVVAGAALFVALGGGAYAVTTNSVRSVHLRDNDVRSVDLKNNDVRSVDIRNGEIQTPDLANGAVTSGKIADGTIRAADLSASVRSGIQGPPGPPGPAGSSLAAFADGNQAVQVGVADVVVRSISVTPPVNGKLIVNASGQFSLVTTPATGRCSITTGTTIDTNRVQGVYVVHAPQALALTRGLRLNAGVPTTVNLVCDTQSSLVSVRDTSLTGVLVAN